MDFNDLLNSGCLSLSIFEDHYARYLQNDENLDPSWATLFEQLETKSPSLVASESSSHPILPFNDVKGLSVVYYPKIEFAITGKDWRVHRLIQGYRTFGYLMANIDPIATHSMVEPEDLKIENFGFSRQDFSIPCSTQGLMKEEMAPLLELISVLKSIYCDGIGLEYVGFVDAKIESWLQERVESNYFKSSLSIDQKQEILRLLNQSELFESFLHTKFVGQKRFSLEGGETLIPMLAALIDTGSLLGVDEFVIGMSHRGRLNVLSNIFNKSHAEIFSEFEEGYLPLFSQGSGDVKYHKGFYSEVKTIHGASVKLTLNPNPSHLESVDAVVLGQVRAKQEMRGDITRDKVMPILIHGDAAISGQGVVYEMMQFKSLEGYRTGGTIHIVVNNQIGFTTMPEDARSTKYCTDIAKIFGCPIFHVNAEDPELAVRAIHLAVELRQQFHCDVFVELNCYRKYGHNEGDEPAFTQPLAYQLIKKKRPIRELYRDELITQGVVEQHLAKKLELEFKVSLQSALADRTNEVITANEQFIRKPIKNISTGVSKFVLQEIANHLCKVPDDFHIHSKLLTLLQERSSMCEDHQPINWGMAEMLAYGSLLLENIDIRLSGQDSCRGTFNHRHAVFIDQQNETKYIPLQHLSPSQGKFEIYNSPLSEYAVLGFEFGFSVAHPQALTIWEAQFGDFCNVAQVIIDQYITTAEQKWGQLVPLTLFLPHGYEGMGPEHSSGRMERFLTLAGDANIQVVNCTTPAQFFHLLRRQMICQILKPLIVFTPKGLLRHPKCVSVIDELINGEFQEIIDDPAQTFEAECLILCSGRIYYDLIEELVKFKGNGRFSIIRIEQLYPFNEPVLKTMIAKYKRAKKCLWVQEEPSNMGAWSFVQPIIRSLLPPEMEFSYVGRDRSAAVAVGSHAVHKQEYLEIMRRVYES